ncbi:unnamed protein product [Fraxinus pennsylvanica]|uniref:Uncharacterized protein n=1 Tax=Fraxinus pennsylvanica TaxID=56036 RepID=A0AAD1ZK70_9LAMI|nr:unnamed protein product [Fraxinus pennsylvanica]
MLLATCHSGGRDLDDTCWLTRKTCVYTCRTTLGYMMWRWLLLANKIGHVHVSWKHELIKISIENNGGEHIPPPGFPEEANSAASEDDEAQTDASSNFHDQLSPLKGEVEGGDSSLDSKSNLDSEPQEHVDIPDESQEENEDLLLKENKETSEVSTSCHVKEKCHLIDTNLVQNFNVEKNDLEVNEIASPEDAILDTSTQSENSAAISEPPNDYLVFPEEMILTVSELGNGENMSYGNQTHPSDKEINQLVSLSADQSQSTIESESKEDEDEDAVGINSSSSPREVDPVGETDNRNQIGWTESIPSAYLDTNEVIQMLAGTESGPTRECIDTSKENGDEEATNEGILAKEVPGEEDASTTENGHETDNREGIADVQECNGCEQFFQECSIANVSYEINETSTKHSLDNTETNVAQSAQTNSIPSPGGVGVSLELRKSSSSDLGVSFDARSAEFDQTPLLYQDKTATRSFSSCATLIRTSLQYDQEVGVEEKTIRLMERSNSENSRAPFPNAIKKEEKAIAMYTEEKQETNGVDKKGDKDLLALEQKELVSNSPKGNAKRRPKYSIFTTCICCTAAIS